MLESNESTEQSPAPSGPDFNEELKAAQSTGDFDYVLETAKKSHKMLVDFDVVVKKASFAGSDAACVAMGLNFLANMIQNSSGQLAALKQAEKQTREAMRAAARAKANPGVAIPAIEACGHGIALSEKCAECAKEPLNQPEVHPSA